MTVPTAWALALTHWFVSKTLQPVAVTVLVTTLIEPLGPSGSSTLNVKVQPAPGANVPATHGKSAVRSPYLSSITLTLVKGTSPQFVTEIWYQNAGFSVSPSPPIADAPNSP